jgi:hypothetical protein
VSRRLLGLWLRPAQDDNGPCGQDLRPAAPATPDSVDNRLEVVKVTDAHPGKGVWITREGERFDDLGEIGHRFVDLVDLCAGSESQLDERFDLVAGESVVQKDGVAADQTYLLEACDSAFGGWW